MSRLLQDLEKPEIQEPSPLLFEESEERVSNIQCLIKWLNQRATVKKQLEERNTGNMLETTQMISTGPRNKAFLLNDSSCCEVTVLGEESDDHHTQNNCQFLLRVK